MLFKKRRAVPFLRQSETAECGYACLAMVAGYYGLEIDMVNMRNRASASLKGVTLASIIVAAEELDLSARPLKAELRHLSKLRLPAVLHWNFSHFVVLTEIQKDGLILHDPAVGIRTVTWEDASESFTGIALELSPNSSFVPRVEKSSVRFRDMLGRLSGLKRSVGEVLFLAAVLEIINIAAPLFMQLIIDKALVNRDQGLILTLAVGFFILACFQIAVFSVRSWLLVQLGTQVNLQLANNLLRHLLRLKLEFFEKRNIGDITSRFDSLATIQRTLTGSFLETMFDGVMALVTLVVMSLYSSKLTLVVLAACSLYVILRLVLYHPYRRTSEEQLVHAAKQHTSFLETVRGMQSIKLFNKEEARRLRWQNIAIDNFNSTVRLNKIAILYQGLNSFLFATENVIVIALGANAVINGQLTAGMLVALLAYKQIFVNRTSALVEKLMEFRLLSLHKERVADIALAEEEQTRGQRSANRIGGAPALELRKVTFSYSSSEPPVLLNVSLVVYEGESVAIIGPSGVGKTTLLKLMLGLLEPTSGQIIVHGVPMKDLGTKAFRDMVGTVMQDDTLFSGTIGDNICFFDPEPSQELMLQAAKTACIHADVEGMPMGYRTFVGDMGSSLSGGQRQRVLFARALYKKPSILLLDEATSNLDVVLERSLSESIQALSLTRVIVAHRPETIASAGRIFDLTSCQTP